MGNGRSTAAGCGQLLLGVLAAAFLLLVNGIAAASLCPLIIPSVSDPLSQAQLAKLVMFVAPVFMFIAELWLYDRVMNWRRSRRGKTEGG